MIVVIDNYDSFTYNLVQYMGELGADPEVHRNDAITPSEIAARSPRGVIISPGPCTPDEAGVSVDVAHSLSGSVPILGVCLGHQSIGAAFGAKIVRTAPVHGKASRVEHGGDELFAGIENPLLAGRYHSLVVEDVPETLVVTARTADGIVMGLRHRDHPTFGLQFHPESILTGHGQAILRNFLILCQEIET